MAKFKMDEGLCLMAQCATCRGESNLRKGLMSCTNMQLLELYSRIQLKERINVMHAHGLQITILLSESNMR